LYTNCGYTRPADAKENNALKFGESTNCIRIELSINNTTTEISCTDAGLGISPGFIRHSIFDPFSQEDPVTEGTGLGLSIVEQTAAILSGDVRIDSSKEHGSAFSVKFPSSHVLYEAPEQAADSPDPQTGTAGLHQLDMSLFTPSRWRTGDTIRDQRCTRLLLDSLMKSLSRWFNIRVIPWQSPSTASRSRLLVALKEDEDSALRAYGDTSNSPELIILCPDVQTALSPYSTPSEHVATIAGPVTTSKLQDALAHLYPNKVPPSDLRHNADQVSRKLDDQQQSVAGNHEQLIGEATDDNSPAALLSRLGLEDKPRSYGEKSAAQPVTVPVTSPSVIAETELSHNFTGTLSHDPDVAAQTEQAKAPTISTPLEAVTAEPRLLLVDDNVINLKVLTMYARKCSKTPATSVGGGRQAINAFKSALEPDDGTVSQPYDVVFLDLSMPEVSGFDVAREIRETEARLRCNRTYICALTGLVSGKDRNAAYASGVDDYLVRPTTLKDLQGVIEIWRNSLTE
jgi:CheY-like chemotaxis protein